ncbi:hypothetical protein ACHAXT_004722 [Thalassiosira profunda]
MLLFILQRCRGGGEGRRFAGRIASFVYPPHRRHAPTLQTTCFSASARTALAASSGDFDDNSSSSDNPPIGSPESRFFVPVSPKASGGDNFAESAPDANDKPEARMKSPSPRPRASSSSNWEYTERQRSERPQQPSVMSTRALYQFRPLAPGSSREMPPSISDYDAYDYGVGNTGNGDDAVGMGSNDYRLEMNDDPYSVAEEETARSERTASREMQAGLSSGDSAGAATEKAPLSFKEAMETGTALPFSADAIKATPQQSNAVVPQTPASSELPRQRAIARVTPSFMEPEKTKAMISPSEEDTDADGQRRLPTEASNGSSGTSHLTSLTHQLEHLTQQIYALNDGVEFNINSPKQVAKILFGEDTTGDTSTNKDVLEAMASAGNQMAASIYKFRKLSREMKREQRRMQQQEKGDINNDYYGNLARAAKSNSDGASTGGGGEAQGVASVTPASEQVASDENNMTKDRRREPLLLIDASAYIFRSYHAIPPLHHSDGTPTGALHGVCRMLQNLLLTRMLNGDRPRVVLAFDAKGPNFRHDLYPEYKANRGPCPEDLIPQFELVQQACDAFGVVQVEAEGYEADDVIATLTRQALDEGVDVDILSGDKDLMQLITPPGTEPSANMIDAMHFDRVDHGDVVKKWGVSSEKLGDVLALAGDSSDNIPGAPGIGPKIAATLINEYGTLDALIAAADQIKQKKRRESVMENAEQVLLCRKLVALDESIPNCRMTLPESYDSVSSFRMSSFDPGRLIDFYKRMELNSCLNQLESRLRSRPKFKPPPTPEEYEGVPF